MLQNVEMIEQNLSLFIEQIFSALNVNLYSELQTTQ